jgi:hypothetical protein
MSHVAKALDQYQGEDVMYGELLVGLKYNLITPLTLSNDLEFCGDLRDALLAGIEKR